MLIVYHRRNTKELLRETPSEWGVEVDVRSYANELVVNHEPFQDAISFESWLSDYRHSLLILNIKEEGLESRLLNKMKENRIEDFFLLDQTFPYLVKTFKSGENRCAVRVSEYESVETARAVAGNVKWVWVDVFSRFPLDCRKYQTLKECGFKLCLVSPELQGHPKEMLLRIKEQMSESGITMDAVCTKEPQQWLSQ
jgi:hypothetical protein